MSAGDGGDVRTHIRRREYAAVAASILFLTVMLTLAWRTIHHDPDQQQHAPGPAEASASSSPPASPPAWRYDPVAVPPVSAGQLAALPEATTDTTIPAAPVDTDRAAGTDGAVVHNHTTVAVYDAPGGTAFARLPPTQAGSATWLPVIDRQPGWVRVLLPNRPNGATGWLDATRMELARTAYEIRANVTARRITLWHDGQPAGQWPIAVGAASTPTPTGRTFVLASITDPAQPYSPVILPLGTHSTTLATYHGGPATTALHTWPDDTVYGHAVSNGCLRIPPDALTALRRIPLGTLVRIDP